MHTRLAFSLHKCIGCPDLLTCQSAGLRRPHYFRLHAGYPAYTCCQQKTYRSTLALKAAQIPLSAMLLVDLTGHFGSGHSAEHVCTVRGGTFMVPLFFCTCLSFSSTVFASSSGLPIEGTSTCHIRLPSS